MPTRVSGDEGRDSGLTDEHKAALAEGREQGRIVRRYLDALHVNKPQRGRKKVRRSPEQLRARLEGIGIQMASADALTRLHLAQERLEVEAELEAGDEDALDMASLEAEFVRVAAAYSGRKGLTREAWRRVGVPPSVLRRAGVQ